MVSVVIHAGCYKTATSTIQAIAQKNRDRFLKNFGVLYPTTGTRTNQGVPDADSVAHHLLYHAARAAAEASPQTAKELDTAFEATRTRLAAEVSKARAQRVLVSTELLSFSPKAVKARFLNYFQAISNGITVVYALRRPDEMIESMNNQMLRAGRGRLRIKDYVEYRPDIEHWIALLGAEKVRVLYFAKSRYDAYINEVFGAAAVDVTQNGVVTDVYANAPMSVSGHVIRAMIFDRLKERNVEIDRARRHTINLALAPIDAKLSPTPKLVTLSAADRTRILKRNEADLEAVKAWLSPDDQARLDEDFRQGLAGPHPEPNLNALAELSKDDLAVLIRGIMADPTLRDLLSGG